MKQPSNSVIIQKTVQNKVQATIKKKEDELYALIKADARWLEDNKIQLKFNLPIMRIKPIIPGREQKWFEAEAYILCSSQMHPNQNTVTVQHKDNTVGYFCNQEVLWVPKSKEIEVDNYLTLATLHHNVNLHSFTLQDRLDKLAKQSAIIRDHCTLSYFYSSGTSDRFKYILNKIVVPNIEVVDSWEIEILKQLRLIEALEKVAG